MIGFGADNAAVMMGNKTGVKAKLMEVNPSIFLLLESFPKAWKFCRNVFNNFSNSSQRSEALTEFQLFVNIKPSVMLHPSQTRWLSLQAVTNRISDSRDALKLYFTNY
ncbi:hypothetical protein HUJ04_011216 [Dendroctonus ponderosae]|nr:hypothetical protein HUJ04_011216 [Dendroctonus ponderosae]